MDRHGLVSLQTPTAIGSASAAIPTAAVGPAVVVPTASSAVTAARTEDRLGAGIVVVGARAGMRIAPTDPDAQHRSYSATCTKRPSEYRVPHVFRGVNGLLR